MNQKVPIHQLLYSTIRIETKMPTGTSFGTGFIVQHYFEGAYYLFLVTNKHVVEGASEGSFFFTKANNLNEPILGDRFDVYSNFNNVWFSHPGGGDIVVTPLLPLLYQIQNKGQHVYYKAISLSMIPNKEQEEKLTALEEITFIGYPNAIYDSKNLLPIIRKGTTATPIFVDYEGKPIFLIDASVFPGSSGSPVFIYNFGNYSDSEGNVTIGNRIYFIGIITQTLFSKDRGSIEFEEIPTSKVPVVKTEQMIDLGVVIKPRVLVETIEAFLNFVKPQMRKTGEENKNGTSN